MQNRRGPSEGSTPQPVPDDASAAVDRISENGGVASEVTVGAQVGAKLGDGGEAAAEPDVTEPDVTEPDVTEEEPSAAALLLAPSTEPAPPLPSEAEETLGTAAIATSGEQGSTLPAADRADVAPLQTISQAGGDAPEAGIGIPSGQTSWAPAPGTEPFVSTTPFIPVVPPTMPSSIPVATPVSTVEAPPKRSRFRRNQRRAQHRRSRGRGWKVGAVVLVVVVAGGIVVGVRASAKLPPATVRSTLPGPRSVSGAGAAIPWPSGVQSAVSIPALGVTVDSGPESPVPIASLTKMMTARIILADHPLPSGQDGPTVTITSDDVTLYNQDVMTGQANLEVAAGEVLTERQMLEGMLVHSANNFADLLAVWDSGSIATFVTKMNSEAVALGMTHTSYTDASGLAPQTVSTPIDQLKLASAEIVDPVFDQMVNTTTVTVPVAGTVGTYTPLIGFDGVVGIKSGFTSAAGGCDVLALTQRIDGVPVKVLAAVVGVQGGDDLIGGAGLRALSIASSAAANVRLIHIASPGEEVGVATLAGHSVPVVARAAASALAWPGQRISETLRILNPPPAGAPAGWRIGSVTAQVGQQNLEVPARTQMTLPTPSFLQRVF